MPSERWIYACKLFFFFNNQKWNWYLTCQYVSLFLDFKCLYKGSTCFCIFPNKHQRDFIRTTPSEIYNDLFYEQTVDWTKIKTDWLKEHIKEQERIDYFQAAFFSRNYDRVDKVNPDHCEPAAHSQSSGGRWWRGKIPIRAENTQQTGDLCISDTISENDASAADAGAKDDHGRASAGRTLWDVYGSCAAGAGPANLDC